VNPASAVVVWELSGRERELAAIDEVVGGAQTDFRSRQGVTCEPGQVQAVPGAGAVRSDRNRSPRRREIRASTGFTGERPGIWVRTGAEPNEGSSLCQHGGWRWVECRICQE
jgi:hypothetical protein